MILGTNIIAVVVLHVSDFQSSTEACAAVDKHMQYRHSTVKVKTITESEEEKTTTKETNKNNNQKNNGKDSTTSTVEYIKPGQSL